MGKNNDVDGKAATAKLWRDAAGADLELLPQEPSGRSGPLDDNLSRHSEARHLPLGALPREDSRRPLDHRGTKQRAQLVGGYSSPPQLGRQGHRRRLPLPHGRSHDAAETETRTKPCVEAHAQRRVFKADFPYLISARKLRVLTRFLGAPLTIFGSGVHLIASSCDGHT